MNDRYITIDKDVEIKVGEKKYYTTIRICGCVDVDSVYDVCYESKPERLDDIIDAEDFIPDLLQDWYIQQNDRAEAV